MFSTSPDFWRLLVHFRFMKCSQISAMKKQTHKHLQTNKNVNTETGWRRCTKIWFQFYRKENFITLRFSTLVWCNENCRRFEVTSRWIWYHDLNRKDKAELNKDLKIECRILKDIEKVETVDSTGIVYKSFQVTA